MKAILVFAAVALSAAFTPAALADPFKVAIDQTVLLKLSSPANSVVVGNASIADVAVHDPMTLLITGKSSGATNMMVLDAGGRTIYANGVQVADNEATELTVVRGAGGGINTYSCIDKCRPTVKAGDQNQFFSETLATVSGKAAAAKGSQ